MPWMESQEKKKKNHWQLNLRGNSWCDKKLTQKGKQRLCAVRAFGTPGNIIAWSWRVCKREIPQPTKEPTSPNSLRSLPLVSQATEIRREAGSRFSLLGSEEPHSAVLVLKQLCFPTKHGSACKFTYCLNLFCKCVRTQHLVM